MRRPAPEQTAAASAAKRSDPWRASWPMTIPACAAPSTASSRYAASPALARRTVATFIRVGPAPSRPRSPAVPKPRPPAKRAASSSAAPASSSARSSACASGSGSSAIQRSTRSVSPGSATSARTRRSRRSGARRPPTAGAPSPGRARARSSRRARGCRATRRARPARRSCRPAGRRPWPRRAPAARPRSASCAITRLSTAITARSIARRRRRLQVGRGVAGVRGDAGERQAGGAGAAVELAHEQQVRELGLAVRGPAEVAPLALEVVEVDPARPVGVARQRHHARRVARAAGGRAAGR